MSCRKKCDVKIFEKNPKNRFLSHDLMLKHVISKRGHLKFREKIMLKCTLGQITEMEKEIGERFFFNYFILIFIHQTISTYHNKVTKA